MTTRETALRVRLQRRFIPIRCSAPWVGLLSLVLLLGSSAPASAQTCVTDVSGVSPNCSANDVSTTLSVVGVLNNDDCAYIGDTATIRLRVTMRANAARYDAGFFVALDGGNARTGSCARAYLTPLAGCQNPPVPAPNPTSGTGPFSDLDCGGGDICGDLVGGVSTSYDLDVVIACRDTTAGGGDGVVDLATIISWKQPGDNDICTLNKLPIPGTKSKCDYQLAANVVGLPVPRRTIIVKKDLGPATDSGRFDLRTTGPNAYNKVATNVGDGGILAPGDDLSAGAYTVSEIASAGTNLPDYSTTLTCVDRVGYCRASNGTLTTQRCVFSPECSGANETCTAQDPGFTGVPIVTNAATTSYTLPAFSQTVQSAIECTFRNTKRTIRLVKDLEPTADVDGMP